MADTPSLQVQISANTKALEDGLNRVSGAVDQLTAVTQRGAESAGRSLDRMGVQANMAAGFVKGLVGALGGAQIVKAIGEGIKELSELGDTAKRAGVDLARLQELRFSGRAQGVAGKTINSGLEGLAEKLNEAAHTENKLSKLFDENNLKLKTRTGEVISTNEALGQVANLVQNAATEWDKIKIVEAVGLTREWIPLLERGADGLRRQAEEARAAGAVIDEETIKKAKQFEDEWAAAVARWTQMFKANLGDIINMIEGMIGLASKLVGAVGRYAERISAEQDIEANGISGASRDTLTYLRAAERAKGYAGPFSDEFRARLEAFEQGDRETARARGLAGLPYRAPGPRLPTKVSSLFGGGRGRGRSSGGDDEAEKAEARLARYTDQLKRQGDVLEAEIATFGQSNAARKAAVEIAKAQVDLERLDAGTKASVTNAIRAEVEANEGRRAQLDRMRGALDASRSAAQGLTDTLADIAFEGRNAGDAMTSLLKSIGRQAFSALLAGSGPFAQALGTKDTGGLFGSVIGSLFGGFRAGGGSVVANRAYVVGERRPELFVPDRSGVILPHVPGTASGSAATSAPTIVQNISANSERIVREAALAGAMHAMRIANGGAAARQIDMARRA